MSSGPILRLFEARAKTGCSDQLTRKFCSTSAGIVKNEPGNAGYFFGNLLSNDEETLIFASIWVNLEAIQERFGNEWQHSMIPDGYGELIDSCSVRHFDLQGGWHLK